MERIARSWYDVACNLRMFARLQVPLGCEHVLVLLLQIRKKNHMLYVLVVHLPMVKMLLCVV